MKEEEEEERQEKKSTRRTNEQEAEERTHQADKEHEYNKKDIKNRETENRESRIKH